MTKKKTKKKHAKPKKTALKKTAASKRRPVKKKATKKLAKKKAAPKKKPVLKKAAVKTKAIRKTEGAKPADVEKPSRPAVQSGDLQGLSNVEAADSESVGELIEEGNAFEAEVVAGVEDAGSRVEREVRTHEVPEDDVPGEYLDKD
jgi:BRCT domain type II-containing protein